MGAAFVSQQFLQNALGYSTLEAGAAFLPAVVFMVIVAPRSAKLVESCGARFMLLLGYVFLLVAFVTMLLLWKQHSPYWHIALAYVLIGVGVGLAGTPASHSLTGSVPVRRAGLASGTADLQRDLDGAIVQSIFGALLTFGYATAATAAIAGVQQARQLERRKPADQVIRGRGDDREAISALREPDHLDDEGVVPARRSMGVHSRPRRRRARRGACLLVLLQARAGARAAGSVRHRGFRRAFSCPGCPAGCACGRDAGDLTTKYVFSSGRQRCYLDAEIMSNR
jgi:hypothetical protein